MNQAGNFWDVVPDVGRGDLQRRKTADSRVLQHRAEVAGFDDDGRVERDIADWRDGLDWQFHTECSIDAHIEQVRVGRRFERCEIVVMVGAIFQAELHSRVVVIHHTVCASDN